MDFEFAIDAAAATAQRDFRVPPGVARRLAVDLLLVAASVRTSCCLDYVPSASSARHALAMMTAMARSMNIQERLVIVDSGAGQACFVLNRERCLARFHDLDANISKEPPLRLGHSYVFIHPPTEEPKCATAAEARSLSILLRLCIGHILASEPREPQPQHQRTSALPSAASVSSHSFAIMTAACVFDALPALASTIVGWLLEYPIIYCLLSPREVAEWGALLFEPEEYAAATSIASDMDAPFRLGMDLAHCSQWWSRCGGPRVAALVAQTLARGDNRRHALTSTSAWLFEVYAKASGGTEHGLVERDERGVFMATSANKNAEEHGRAEDCDDDDDDDAFANSMLRSRKKAATKIPKPSKSGRSLPSASDAADPEFCFCFSLPSALCVAACHCIVGADGDNTSNEDEALARLLARYRASLSASASAHASALCISVRASQTLLEHVAL